MKRVDKMAPVPAYYQLKEIIREKINHQEWKPGDRIPTEKEFGTLNRISRMTVRQAINELCNDGLLYRLRGVGTFVSKRKIERDLDNLESLTQSLRAAGHEVAAKVLKFDKILPSQELSEKLGIKTNEEVIRLERLRFLNGAPLCLQTTYLPFNLCPELMQENLEKDALLYLLENKFGLRPDRGVIVLEAIAADQVSSKLLGVKKGFPLIHTEQVICLDDGQPMEFINMFIRGDKYKYHMTRRRKK